MSFTVGCFGYGGTVALIEQFREELELAGVVIKTCHEHENATVKYDRTKIHAFIDSCDIILLPCRTKLQPAKSVNRLALALSRKKACVVSPLDAYLKYFKDGESVLIAETKEQWLECVIQLRDDPSFRERIAAKGYEITMNNLNPVNQVSKLFVELSKHGVLGSWPQDTFVQVVIPHYADRLDYLEKTVKSVVDTWGPDRNILIVSSSKKNPKESAIKDYPNVRIIHQADRLSFSQANNIGLRNADSRTTHLLLLNDDTIVAHKALGNMVRAMYAQGNSCVLNPYSNCDKGWLHNDTLQVGSKDLHPNMKIEEFHQDQLDAIFKFDTTDKMDVIESPFCAFYCTLIPKKVFQEVGYLNTLFKNGGEDLDYCERAKRYGYSSYWTKSVFCFHFGGKTRAVSESEDFAQHHKEDAENNILVKKRWASNKKRIAIWTGPAWESWDLNTYKTTGIGGSETCAGRLAQTAAALGHSVTMYGSHECKEQDGVQLMPWDSFKPEEEYFDLFIASRNINCIDERLKAKKILVWVHDIWLLSGKNISTYHLNKVDKFVCLSPWHVDFFANHHQIPKNKITIIPNGINTELFDAPNLENKHYGKLVYSSSPDRGLDNLIYCMIFAKDKVPELHLDVFYGFHNYESAVLSRNNEHEVRRLNELKEVIERHKDFVTMHGRVSQPDLAKVWSKAYGWVYNSNFTETYCCLPSTQITMASGRYKKIPDVLEGDEVVTHRGIGKVTHTMNRNVDEKIYKIKVKNLKDPLEITGEHPVLVLAAKENRCSRFSRLCKKTYKGCTHYVRKDKKGGQDYVLTEPCKKYHEKFSPTWVKAESLKRGDYVCIVKNNTKNEPPLFSDVLNHSTFEYRNSYEKDNSLTTKIEDFKLDGEFLEFCGWYLAEGLFDGKSAITFSLHKDEVDEASLIKKQLERIGLTYREDLRENTRSIVTHSVVLGQFFASFGRISNERRIPKWVKDLDAEYLKYFLRGFYHGDGCEILNTVKAEGASSDLVYDLFEVLLKFKCLSHTANSMKKKPQRVGKIIQHSETEKIPAFLSGVSMSQNKEFFKFFGYTPNEDGFNNLYIEDDVYVYLPITKIESYDYVGAVYNFEVEGDNSYVANNVVVHNCITAKEAQLSATPIVCSNVAALQTTVGEFGHIVKHDPYSYEGRLEFVDQMVKLHKDKDYWLELSQKSLLGSHRVGWQARWDDYWSTWL
jgi:GT2 family glycosyltransferase/intein/homing endonuclease